MQIIIDSSEPIEDVLRLVGKFYNVDFVLAEQPEVSDWDPSSEQVAGRARLRYRVAGSGFSGDPRRPTAGVHARPTNCPEFCGETH